VLYHECATRAAGTLALWTHRDGDAHTTQLRLCRVHFGDLAPQADELLRQDSRPGRVALLGCELDLL
jgi:hypothetical protein